jgi:hypothetical protein
MQESREALAALQDQSEDIGLSAINSLLLARGDELTSRTMSNLAAAVGEHARHTSAELQTCKSLMERLTEGSEAMAASILQHAEVLEATLAAAQRDLHAEDARAETRREGETAALQAVKALEHALGDAMQALDALRPVPGRLGERAAAIGTASGVPDRDAAGAARAIYTMQRERDVHDAVMGVAPAAEASSDDADEQDLDDIFL